MVSKNPLFKLQKRMGLTATGAYQPDGVKYSLRRSAALMERVTAKIEMPPVPMWFDKETEREVPNPNHPDYIDAVSKVEQRRGTAIYDALVMFGIRLENGLPQNDEWLINLKFMAKHEMLDLDEFDLDDQQDREFLYKRFVLSNGSMANEIGNLSALSPDDVAKAGAPFPRNPEQPAD
jgi:hypothetical protein